MLDMDKSMNYEELISGAPDNHKRLVKRMYSGVKLFEEGIEDIKNINTPVEVVIFTETRCQDSAIVIPFLLRLSELNENINLSFFRMKGNEDILEKMSGEKRVPTILVLNNDGDVLRKYVELPNRVKYKIKESDGRDRNVLVRKMRMGKFNEYIQKDLIELITGINYEYMDL